MRRLAMVSAVCLLSCLSLAWAQEADLSAIKTYLLGQTAALEAATADLQDAANQYYDLAQGADFDYAALWERRPADVTAIIQGARAAWMKASPLYEQMEGIVAGTPSLAQFDVDLDAGAAATEDPANAVSFDISLPNGEVLAQPGNLFGVIEGTLWGTFEAYRSSVEADLDGNGTIDFAEVLPDANVLKGAADLLTSMASELDVAAQAWEPTASDAFTALVVMVPTMSEYFASWRDSRFVLGEASTQRDFVAISRLSDILDILSSLQVVQRSVSPLIQSLSKERDAQIARGLSSLKTYVAEIYQAEQGGRVYTPEEADILGAEAQNRATAITGQVVQVASLLGIPLQE